MFPNWDKLIDHLKQTITVTMEEATEKAKESIESAMHNAVADALTQIRENTVQIQVVKKPQ